jgi:hypothetical protein
MAWIKTVPVTEAEGKLLELLQAQRASYPVEYATPVEEVAFRDGIRQSSIVDSHSLIPEAMYHAFSTFGVLMSPDLPLERYQHEMIATVVSVTNRCHY